MSDAIQPARPDPVLDLGYAQELLDHAGLDGMVATSPEHVFLLTGYGTWLERKLRGWMVEPDGGSGHAAGYAVLSRSREPGLVVSPLLRSEARRASPAGIRPHEGRGLLRRQEAIAALVELLKEMRLNDGRLGVEFADGPSGLRDRLAAALPGAVLRDCSVLLRLCRMKKSSEALRRLRGVASATEEALREAFLAESRPPSPELRFREGLARRGADLDHLVFGIHGDGVGMSYADARGVAGYLYLDAGAHRDWFYSDTGLTLAGPASDSPVARARFDRALDALRAGADALRPGTAASVVHRVMRDVASGDRGLGVQGHGLGIDIRELPIVRGWTAGVMHDETITVGVDLVLEIGMVVNLEASGFYGDESVQIEETFVVTAHGAEPIVDRSRADPWRTRWR